MTMPARGRPEQAIQRWRAKEDPSAFGGGGGAKLRLIEQAARLQDTRSHVLIPFALPQKHAR